MGNHHGAEADRKAAARSPGHSVQKIYSELWNLSSFVKFVAHVNENVAILSPNPETKQVMQFRVVLALSRPLPPIPGAKKVPLREDDYNLHAAAPVFPDHFIHPYTASGKAEQRAPLQVMDDHFLGSPKPIVTLSKQPESDMAADVEEHVLSRSKRDHSARPQHVSEMERPCLPEESFCEYRARLEASRQKPKPESHSKIDVLAKGHVVVLVNFSGNTLEDSAPDFKADKVMNPKDFTKLANIMETQLASPKSPHIAAQMSQENFEIIDVANKENVRDDHIQEAWKFVRSKVPYRARYLPDSAIILSPENVLFYQNKVRDMKEASLAPRVPQLQLKTPNTEDSRSETAQKSQAPSVRGLEEFEC
mmetsp:Transcript_4019/g.9464  ORF Transcript_4019/g.9464 Transcript_4019/m.9464 type:complete len:364 (+) Transcript_4019:188-1279(+)